MPGQTTTTKRTTPTTIKTTTPLPTTTPVKTTTPIKTTTMKTTTVKTTTPIKTTTPGLSNDCEFDGQTLPYPGDCHKYYICYNEDDSSPDYTIEVFDCGEWVFGP